MPGKNHFHFFRMRITIIFHWDKGGENRNDITTSKKLSLHLYIHTNFQVFNTTYSSNCITNTAIYKHGYLKNCKKLNIYICWVYLLSLFVKFICQVCKRNPKLKFIKLDCIKDENHCDYWMAYWPLKCYRYEDNLPFRYQPF